MLIALSPHVQALNPPTVLAQPPCAGTHPIILYALTTRSLSPSAQDFKLFAT
jgi:hypothetical protein